MNNEDAWWRAGAGFRWCWPRFNVYIPADKKPNAGLNRYPHNIIGAGVCIFGRCWGVRWKDSGRRHVDTTTYMTVLDRLEEALKENEELRQRIGEFEQG